MWQTCNQIFGGMLIEMEAPPQIEQTPMPFTIHIWTALVASALMSATMYDIVLMDVFRGFVASNGGGIAEALPSPCWVTSLLLWPLQWILKFKMCKMWPAILPRP